MLGMMQLLRHEEIDKMLVASTTAAPLTKGVRGLASASSTQVWSGSTPAPATRSTQTANAFVGLERLIGKTERTIRRSLTNGTFGLGPGLGAPRDKEGLLGAPRDKEGLLGAPRDKEGLLAPGQGRSARSRQGGSAGHRVARLDGRRHAGRRHRRVVSAGWRCDAVPGGGGSGRRDHRRQGAARSRWDPRLRVAVTRHARQVPSRTGASARPVRGVDRSETDRSPRGLAPNLRRRPRLTPV